MSAPRPRRFVQPELDVHLKDVNRYPVLAVPASFGPSTDVFYYNPNLPRLLYRHIGRYYPGKAYHALFVVYGYYLLPGKSWVRCVPRQSWRPRLRVRDSPDCPYCLQGLDFCMGDCLCK
eukprot:g18692.t1